MKSLGMRLKVNWKWYSLLLTGIHGAQFSVTYFVKVTTI